MPSIEIYSEKWVCISADDDGNSTKRKRPEETTTTKRAIFLWLLCTVFLVCVCFCVRLESPILNAFYMIQAKRFPSTIKITKNDVKQIFATDTRSKVLSLSAVLSHDVIDEQFCILGVYGIASSNFSVFSPSGIFQPFRSELHWLERRTICNSWNKKFAWKYV